MARSTWFPTSFISFVLISTFAAYLFADDSEAILADAAEARDMARMQALLDDDCDVNQPQADGTTALHWAAYQDLTTMVARLIEHGADVNAENRYGVRPLALACVNGNAEIVRLLLQSSANPNAALRGGETPLMTACRTGRTEPVQLLLEHGAEVNRKERNRQTAIMWAAADGHADVVRLLIEADAEFRESLPSGFNPFFFAVREGRTEVVKVLLDNGIDVNQPMQPTRRGPKFVREGTSALILAVENGHFELANELLEFGADPNDQRSGYAALHALSWVRKPNRGDGEDGAPPPLGSGRVSSLDFVDALIEHGADVNLQLKQPGAGDKRGATPFFMAADTADLPLMQKLLDYGADPQIANQSGTTPLLVAAGLGTKAPGEEAGTEDEAIAAVELLLDLGADINVVDKNKETVMHGAAYKNLPRMVELLAERGADVEVWNQPNRRRWTPLTIAAGYRQGNFKPSPETLAALKQALIDAGVEPPEKIVPPGRQGEDY